MQEVAEQLRILRRGVEQIVPEPEFLEKLARSVREDRPLRVKYGIDPTGIDVHLGHTVPLRKLRQFQDLGHTAVIIIGNYTALVGDPSGRDETRAKLTQEQVEVNARDYLTQVGRIIDLSRAEVHYNGDWFSRWTFLDVLDLARRMTLGQISAREDFSKRIAQGKPVYLHECLYPLMQGWDSVEIRADVELGGTEQLFSLLVARDLQQARGQEPQVALTMPILVGTDGARRMGKSLGNYIGVAESAENQFGKVMSIPDGPMRQYFTLLTAAAEIRRRAAGEDPEEIPEAPLDASQLDAEHRIPAFVLIKDLGMEPSTSSARRVIEQGGVTIGPDRRVISDPKALIAVTDGLIVRVGKRKIVRVRIRR